MKYHVNWNIDCLVIIKSEHYTTYKHSCIYNPPYYPNNAVKHVLLYHHQLLSIFLWKRFHLLLSESSFMWKYSNYNHHFMSCSKMKWKFRKLVRVQLQCNWWPLAHTIDIKNVWEEVEPMRWYCLCVYIYVCVLSQPFYSNFVYVRMSQCTNFYFDCSTRVFRRNCVECLLKITAFIMKKINV